MKPSSRRIQNAYFNYERINYAENFLSELCAVDTLCYETLVNEIYNDSYFYQKYLVLQNYSEIDKEFLSNNIKIIEEREMEDDFYFLYVNIDYFLRFNAKPIEFRNDVYSFFEKNKEYNKIKVKRLD